MSSTRTSTIGRILWLGPYCSADASSSTLASSPAADKWQLGIVSALRRQGIEVELVSHLPDSFWPKGRLIPNPNLFSPDLDGTKCIRYFNVPGVRKFALTQAYKRATNRICQITSGIHAVFTYNPCPWNIGAAESVRRNSGARWVSITLDFDSPGDNFSHFEATVQSADAHVFLSWYAYDKSRLMPKLFIDAGVDEVFPYDPDARMPDGTFEFLYAGKLSTSGGSELLAEAISCADNPNYRFTICGKGDPSPLARLASTDRRISIEGYVDHNRLHELSLRANAFINPRLPSSESNIMVFPSKITNYLAYGKPVVSTWTKGISPEFRSVLLVPDNPSSEALALEFDRAASLSTSQLKSMQEQIFQLLSTTRTWDAIAKRLVDFLRQQGILPNVTTYK